MAVRYGLLSVKGIGQVACDAIRAGQPYASFEDFLERKTSKCNQGHVELLARIGAFDSMVPNRRYLEELLMRDRIKGSDLCRWKTDGPVLITGPLIKGVAVERELPCSYDWPEEPREESKQPGRLRPAKPLPAKCTKACRRFEAIAPPTAEEIEPYTDEDIRRIEMEILGVHLSSTPFDRMDPDDLAECSTAVEVLSGEVGEYMVAGMVRAFRTHVPASGQEMAFVGLTTPRGVLDVAVFSSDLIKYRAALQSTGRLVVAVIRKDTRGHALSQLVDLDA